MDFKAWKLLKSWTAGVPTSCRGPKVAGRNLILPPNLLVNFSPAVHQFFPVVLFTEDSGSLLEEADEVDVDLGRTRPLGQVIELPEDSIWGQSLDVFEKVLLFGRGGL